MELAELAIRIDSRDAKTAEDDLKRLSDTGARTERSLEGVGAAGKEAARGSDATARSSRDATRALDQHDNAAKRLTASVRYFAAASLAAGAAAATWMLSMSRSMDATNKMAEQIGVTTEALTGMRFAAQQFASISDQQFDMSMRRMTRRIEEAAQGGGAAKGAIEGLGLSAQELARLSPDRQMLAIADAMQRTESQARRLQYTMALFDTEGMPLVAALQQGSAAFKENIELAQRYGVVLTTEAANAASSFQTEIDRLHSIMSGFSMDLANQVLPTLNQFVRNAIEAATQVDGLHTEVKDLAKDATFKEWFDAALVGLARVADVAVFVAKSVGTVGLAFQAAAADVQAGLAWLAKPNAADKLLLPAEEYNRLVEEYEAAMGRQQTTVQRFNASLDELLTYQGNRFEQAALRAINTITVTSDKITTVDLTVGGGSAGASEEQLKKLAEWMGRLATPTEKLEETLAKARAELGPLFSPEIERRIRAQFAAQQAGNKIMTEAQRIAQAFTRERQQALRTQYSAISAIQDEAQAIEDQIALFGLSKAAIQDLTIARLEEQAAMLRGFEGSQEQVEAIEREIEARKRLRTAIGSLEQKEAERQQWEDWARDVETIFDQVGQSLTDAIFEGGKSGRDLLKDLFKTLTFRVLIQPVMGQMQGWVTNQLGGLFGVQNPQQGGGMFGLAQNASSLHSAFTGGFTDTLASGVNWLGEKLGSSALQSFAAGMSGAFTATSPVYALTAAGLTGAGATALPASLAIGPGLQASLGTTIGTAGAGAGAATAGGAASAGSMFAAAAPWVMGGLAIASAFGLFDDRLPTTRRSQQGASHMLPDGSWEVSSWDDRQDTASQIAARDFAQAAVKHANDLFERIGIDAQIHSFQTLMESSILGDKQGVGSSGQVRIGDVIRDIGLTVESSWTKHGFGGWSDQPMLPRLQTDIQLTLLEAFQAVGDELPTVLSDMLADVDIRSLGAEQAQALAQSFQLVVDQVSALQVALEKLPFEQLRDLSFDAAANLIQFAGGLEALDQGMTTYFQNFYSEAEQLDFLSSQISGALDELGLAMPDVTQGAQEARAAYRALVESLDVTTEEGQRAYATLMTLSGGFVELTSGIEQLSSATRRAHQELLSSLMGDVSAALSAVQQRGQERIAKLSESFARTDAVFNAYRSQVQALESQWGSLISTMERSMRDLRGQVEVSARLQYDQARAVISTALLTGQMPQTADLSEAIRAAQQGVTSGRYASAFDQREAYLKLANELEALQGIAKPEFDTARASLEQLEKQYNRLRGIEDLSDKSLSQLERQLSVALSAEESARTQIAQIERQISMAQLQYQQLVGINEELSTLPGALNALAKAVNAANAAREAAGPSLGDRATRYLADNPDVLNAYLGGYGKGQTAEQFALEHYNKYGRAEGRSFAVGTSYVPYDMMANIHRGEIIIDPRSSDILRRYGIGVQGGGSRETEQLLREQLAEVRQQNRYLYEIVKSGKRTQNYTEDTARALQSDSDDLVLVF